MSARVPPRGGRTRAPTASRRSVEAREGEPLPEVVRAGTRAPSCGTFLRDVVDGVELFLGHTNYLLSCRTSCGILRYWRSGFATRVLEVIERIVGWGVRLAQAA